MASIVYNGIDLSGIMEIKDVEMSALPPMEAVTSEIPGLVGAAFVENSIGPREIKIKARIATQSIDPFEIQREWSDAVAPLVAEGPKVLSLAQHRYYMAVFTGETALEFASYSAAAELTFLCPDPYAFGATKTVSIPSGGQATFTVGGNRPTKPKITAASAVRNANSKTWGVRLDGGDYLYVDTGSSSARKVVADCGERALTVAGAAALPTLLSDWLVLNPGQHVVKMDQGSGAATLTYVERWAR